MRDDNDDIFRDPEFRYHKLLLLETVFPARYRKPVGRVTGWILVLYIAVFALPNIYQRIAARVTLPAALPEVGGQALPGTDMVAGVPELLPKELHFPGYLPFLGGHSVPLDPRTPRGNALFLLVLIIWLAMKMLSGYRNSYYYDVEAMLERGETGAQTAWTTPNFETCAVFWDVELGDLTRAFCRSRYGELVWARLGIARSDIEGYLRSRKQVVDWRQHYGEVRKIFTLRDLAAKLIVIDPDFYHFLFGLGIRERELEGAVEWVERGIKMRKQRERLWGRVTLGQSPSFGADFAYGAAYRVSRYSEDLSRRAVAGGSNFRFVYGSKEIGELEIILSRAKEANAILVGAEGAGKMDVLLDFARDIMNGFAHPGLAHKRVLAFHAAAMVANMKTKSELEVETLKVFKDAADAGNVILVLDDLPGFVESAAALGSDVVALIDPFLAGSDVHVIATADNARFHRIIEPSEGIMRRFETVLLTEPEDDAMVRIIEEAAEAAERRYHVRFSYPAVIEIVKSARNYLSGGQMPDKAIDLLEELVPWARAHVRGKETILLKKLDVLEYVREKTQIPVGEINDDERKKLTHLEELLRGQVVGQEEALSVIANAMRRSRAGVRNEKRPIGAFLFLGPTGVGKTETAKALANVFFGNESLLERIDMSEYQGEDGLNRMIGSMDGTTGTLPNLLREHPYGVLLLDEFEKTNPKVLDLFLQVFDEGVFHDAVGRPVNARNTIFIATSNAGSEVIREAIAQGIDLRAARGEIIDRVIAMGKYKPELINRFDGVILFHPLTTEDYAKIATLMLEKLRDRLREQHFELVINKPLVDAVMQRGVDPIFGARPMQRAVQDLVEQKVAERIIAGNLKEGATIEFTSEDFA